MPKRLVSPRMRQARIDHVNGPAKNPIVASARNHKSRDEVIRAWQLDPYTPNPLDIPHANDNPSPKTVADFVNEYYRVNGVATTFAAMFTYTGASNKTMTDSDGNLKWAPHNYLPAPENWSTQTTTDVTAGQADPDGGTGAVLFGHTANGGNFFDSTTGPVSGGTYTIKMKVKANVATDGWLRVFVAGNSQWFDANNSFATGTTAGGGIVSASATSLGNDWYQLTVVATYVSTVFGCNASVGNGDGNESTTDSYYIYQAHAYRSDLGGMVNNPDTSSTFVETTTAEVYQSRRNSYRYNGTSYVNKGITLESSAATNKITYSNDLTQGIIFNTNSITITNNQEAGPDGQTSLASVRVTDATNETKGAACPGNGVYDANTNYAFSLYVKYDATNPQRYVGINHLGEADHWTTVVYDLLNGTVASENSGATSGTVVDSGVEDVGGGIYRIWSVSSVGSSGAAADGPRFILCNTGSPSLNNTGTQTYAGSGTETVYIGFFDAVAASTPSSHIPTSGATATRAAETLTIAAANMAYSSTAMSFHTKGEHNITVIPGNDTDIWEWSNAGNNEMFLYSNSGAAVFGADARGEGDPSAYTGTLAGAYADGVNAPFNYASRYVPGSEGNIAANGTTSTAAAAQANMPGVSGDVLNFGDANGESDRFTGTLALFRQWDADIGDAGIELASAA